jgi:Mg2+/Co2+ transporter CorB
MIGEHILIIGGIGILLVVSAFFSGSETALTAASNPRMHELVRQNSRRAGIVLALHQRKSRLIGAILLGNNLVNILASALATSILLEMFGEPGILYATLGMTLLVVIFAEVMPKSYALTHADRMALAVAPVMRWIVVFLAPLTSIIHGVVEVFLKLFGVRLLSEQPDKEREEELRGAIALHTGLEPELRQEQQMLRGILDLDEVEVDEVMTHRRNVEMLDADTPMENLVEAILESRFTRLPLFRDEPDNIIGTVHEKALLRAVRAGNSAPDAIDIAEFASDPWFIPNTTTLLEQLQAFRERREHFALVVDEYGAMLGIVTLEDILEEIVGEIEDEHDRAFRGVRPQSDGSYIVTGSVTIRDLAREFDWNLPDEQAATIAGLVLYEARTIPKAGQVFQFYGFRFEVLRRQRHQISLLRVTPPKDIPVTVS